MSRYRITASLALLLVAVVFVPSVSGCGGLFCQNVPVNQQAERIIFTINDNETVTAYVQINYTGDAPNFSWVVPVPDVPEVDVAEIATFDELKLLTDPVFIPPLTPECALMAVPMAAGGADETMAMPTPTFFDDVTVLSSGTAGPFAFDVITSKDPNALTSWLRSNSYRVDPPMEPLIRVYTEEDMVFLAMKLQPDQDVQDIQPVVMTYPAIHPMIPIRLTAVAANPNMTIETWVFGDEQAVPVNYAHPKIDLDNMRADFTTATGTNYLSLVDQTVDLYAGRAFVTEYAQPTTELIEPFGIDDPLLLELARNYDYVTRLFGRMSPEEMTVDPTFMTFDDIREVSNVHDLSEMDPEVFWGCTNTPVQIDYDPLAVPANF
jgi:hypothetical protein